MSGNKIALIVAALCALGAAVIVANVMQENDRKAKMAKIPKDYVVVAKVAIPARTVITSDQIELRFIPKEAINPDSARKLQDVIGMVTRSEIVANEQINLYRLVKKGDKVDLPFLIPAGMRAITVAVNEVIGVAGFIRPGEHVDVIGTIEPKNSESGKITWTVLQDVEVLAVSQDLGNTVKDEKSQKADPNAKPGTARLGTSVTLAVTPLQAEKITLAEDKGELRLTLRPALKEAEVKVDPIRETSLVPGSSVSYPVKSGGNPPPKRQIEVISGGKSHFVTVD